ncbi:hypothetical protein JD969_07295 [Planctomycetota bacterium]|nr:hypothetical protein JD969_07295 [Planctomycetota bacterium]
MFHNNSLSTDNPVSKQIGQRDPIPHRINIHSASCVCLFAQTFCSTPIHAASFYLSMPKRKHESQHDYITPSENHASELATSVNYNSEIVDPL